MATMNTTAALFWAAAALTKQMTAGGAVTQEVAATKYAAFVGELTVAEQSARASIVRQVLAELTPEQVTAHEFENVEQRDKIAELFDPTPTESEEP